MDMFLRIKCFERAGGNDYRGKRNVMWYHSVRKKEEKRMRDGKEPWVSIFF